jgi:mono/diheme cytochrome c family protein
MRAANSLAPRLAPPAPVASLALGLLLVFAEFSRAQILPPVDFQREIQPVLSGHCLKCHGPEKQKNGLRLDRKTDALRGSDSGPVILPGRAADSKLVRLVSGADPDKIMPQKGERLTAAQIDLLRRWIDQGAVWPDSPAAANAAPGLWSLRPVRKLVPPAVKDKNWARNPVDAFILERLEKSGLKPAPEASRDTLVRRLSFDLLGLPPSPEEIVQFRADKSPRAYENLVERMLASPHYGERWGRHWLDVARYTESQGFEYDHLRENAWHYRDYVIASFNQDKPYNRFVREQIAGDSLAPRTSAGIVATSLLVCGPWDQAGNGQANATQRAVTREEELEDVVSVVGQTFLGMTVNCARCHSHKFDPIPQQDYYRIKSVFEGVRHGESPILPPSSIKQREARIAEINSLIAALRAQLDDLDQRVRLRVLSRRRSQEPPTVVAPLPAVAWRFAESGSNSLAKLGGEFRGGAKIEGGRLILNGVDGAFESTPLSLDIREKTLVARLTLSGLDQRGGGVIGLQNKDGTVFDAIVYGEREPRRWMAGANFYLRTRDLAGPDENSAPGQSIHVAIVYRADNSIALYRNGKIYGESYTPDHPLETFKAGSTRVLLGQRHTGGGNAFLKGAIIEAALYDRALSPAEIQQLASSPENSVTDAEITSAALPEEKATRSKVSADLANARRELAEIPPVEVSYVGTRQQPATTHRLRRGDVKSPLEVVTPGGLSAIADPSPDFGLPADAPEADRRLKFADWLADPRNPLTTRVIANRVWHYHFGQGIVSTPNDFGANGGKPSHPELLDWLAATLVENGWSLKSLHRLIVNSSAYRQSSLLNASADKIDAENELLWRFTPRRLEAEETRDAMLFASGDLNPAQGGPGFRPFDIVKFNSSTYIPADKIGPDFNRRTVYRVNVNSGKDPLLDALDCPDPSIKTPRRNVTITPLQALGLMNDSFVLRQAGHLALRATRESGGDPDRAVARAYLLAVGRAPDRRELKRALSAVRERGLASFCWVLLNSTEFLYVD